MSEAATLVPEKSVSHRIITFSVMLATIMQALDATIANVALPHMQGTLAATQDQMTWVLTSYIVAAAITIPLVGWLSGYAGRKLIFTASIVGFTIASILCGMAENLPSMVFFRLLQGVFGAALVPLSQAILFDINSHHNYGRAMALWGVGVTVGPIIGPALGGWLTENYNWRWVFYINVPIGALAFLGLYWFLPESPSRKTRFDWLGFFTLSLAVGALQLLLDRGELKDWFSSPEIIMESILCGLGFYLFIVHALTYQDPFLNLRLFKDRNFIASTLLIFAVGVVLFATLALIPPMLQNQLHYPVIMTGLVIAPRGAGTMAAMFMVGRLIGRVDARFIMTIGFLLTALSLQQMTHYSLLMDTWSVISAGLIQGLGIGLCYAPLSTVAFSTLPADLRNEGTSFFNLIRNIGSSIGISIVQALLTRNMQIIHSELGEHLIPYNAVANSAYTANHINIASQSGLVKLNYLLTNQSIMVAYIDDYKLMMVMTLAVLPLICLLQPPKKITVSEEPMVMD